MKKLGIRAGILAAVLAVVFAGIRWFAFLAVEHGGLVTARNGVETPATFGAPFERMAIVSGDRRLDAMLVRAAPAAPAILIFHGTAEAVSYWADVQALLRRHGITSMVFDYSGFGESTGRPTVAHLEEDADSAYAAFTRAIGAQSRAYALGYSLGTGIVFAALPRWRRQPDGVIFAASYSSAREGAVEFGLVPRWATFLLPDLWNNMRAVRTLRQPLLVLHSDADRLFPVEMARRVFEAASEPKEMVVLEGFRHEDGHANPSEEYWAPVVRFVTTGARSRE